MPAPYSKPADSDPDYTVDCDEPQLRLVHEIFAPTAKEIAYAEKLVRSFNEQADSGIGVYTVDGKMVDIPFFEDARRTLELAKACGVYDGDL